MDNFDVLNLLKYSENKDIIATKIIDVKGKELDSISILNLLKYLENKDDNITKIINLKGEELSRYDVFNLFKYSINKELIKKLLLQNGVDYNLINNIILDAFDGVTQLIPDNYQSMLNEIRRIKQIMG